MSKPTFINSKVVYHDNSTEFNIDARGKDLASVIRACQTEDITPLSSSIASEFNSDISDSIIFTKKAKKEAKQSVILKALQNSVNGRRDKTRALVKELQYWQNDDYIDPNYNAQVMYDELQKIMRLPFGYDAFKRLYNNTRS
jgi:Ca2+-binding EF-hand superfamily protein